MPQYCDSAALERNWFNWLLASSVPSLEKYRKLGLLWTKVIGMATHRDGNLILRHGQPLPDPSHPIRAHCIALANPVYLNSYSGVVKEPGFVYKAGKATSCPLPTDGELTLLSDSWLHKLDEPLVQLVEVIPRLRARGYLLEPTKDTSWHAILGDINKMCRGISMRFRPKAEEEQYDLANEVLLQVSNKLVNKKLIYTPGRAPVFNLLTTTIYRCIYSILNRKKNQRDSLHKLLTDARAGVLPTHRSLRTQQSRRPIKTH